MTNSSSLVYISEYPVLDGLNWDNRLGSTCSPKQAYLLYKKRRDFWWFFDLSVDEWLFVQNLVKQYGLF